jgi:thiosulfate dehydrogenase [quinone] large subunit
MENKYDNLFAIVRILLGFVFLWAFLDKTFGLGFPTVAEESWLAGSSPTFGYLKFGTGGPFGALWQTIAGNPVVNLLYMGGMLLVGLSLLLGVGLTIAGYSGALIMLLIWASSLPVEFNPFVDEHIIYGVLLIGVALIKPNKLSIGSFWTQTEVCQRYPVLQ